MTELTIVREDAHQNGAQETIQCLNCARPIVLWSARETVTCCGRIYRAEARAYCIVAEPLPSEIQRGHHYSHN